MDQQRSLPSSYNNTIHIPLRLWFLVERPETHCQPILIIWFFAFPFPHSWPIVHYTIGHVERKRSRFNEKDVDNKSTQTEELLPTEGSSRNSVHTMCLGWRRTMARLIRNILPQCAHTNQNWRATFWNWNINKTSLIILRVPDDCVTPHVVGYHLEPMSAAMPRRARDSSHFSGPGFSAEWMCRCVFGPQNRRRRRHQPHYPAATAPAAPLLIGDMCSSLSSIHLRSHVFDRKMCIQINCKCVSRINLPTHMYTNNSFAHVAPATWNENQKNINIG